MPCVYQRLRSKSRGDLRLPPFIIAERRSSRNFNPEQPYGPRAACRKTTNKVHVSTITRNLEYSNEHSRMIIVMYLDSLTAVDRPSASRVKKPPSTLSKGSSRNGKKDSSRAILVPTALRVTCLRSRKNQSPPARSLYTAPLMLSSAPKAVPPSPQPAPPQPSPDPSTHHMSTPPLTSLAKPSRYVCPL